MRTHSNHGKKIASASGLLAALLLTSSFAARAATLHDGVVIDAARSLAYVMQPAGGIDAVDLTRGTTRWHSAGGERPLTLAGGVLVAQAAPGANGELRIVALDLDKNGARSAEADFALPAGLRADVVETPRQTFRVKASPSAQGIVVTWSAQPLANLPGRAAQRLEETPAVAGKAVRPQEVRQGTLLFDPHAGSLLALAAADARQLVAGGRPVVASLSAPTAAERRFASIDGLHVLASRHSADAAGAAGAYTWTISDAATGAVLGTVSSPVAMAPFVVAGGELIHVVQPGSHREGKEWIARALRLRAVDLATGNEAWSRDLRDTAYRGPVPH
jgi:hypothetical protein